MDKSEDIKTLGFLNGCTLGSVYAVCGQGREDSSKGSCTLYTHEGRLVAFTLLPCSIARGVSPLGQFLSSTRKRKCQTVYG